MAQLKSSKILFLDRDGTLIAEPADFQIDTLEKFQLLPSVIPSLLQLKSAGFRFVMVTNQDGLGTAGYPVDSFDKVQKLLVQVFQSQGITFEETLICPHFEKDGCTCRKPKTGLLKKYLSSDEWSREDSYVIGDRQTDVVLGENLGVKAILYSSENGWELITRNLLSRGRVAEVIRKTKETEILVKVDLDGSGKSDVSTGIGFFDHMLEQIARHSGMNLTVKVKGDLHIDDHHTIEDTALALGAAIRKALGEKRGIERYGFLLPMDESEAEVALDLSGRPYFKFDGVFSGSTVGAPDQAMNTEMVPHFFRSLSETLAANLHIKVRGVNTHHQVEAMFKCVARALKQAISIPSVSSSENDEKRYALPSTKGVL